jgi:hypothetical protein
MEAIYFSETSVTTQQTTRRHNPEDDTVHNIIRHYILSSAYLALEPRKLAQTVMFLICIWEDFGSNLFRDSDYQTEIIRDFP